MAQEQYMLILGAGLLQRPSLEAAASLGYKTLVVDANPNALCVPFADRFEPIDLKDKEKIAHLALGMKGQVAGVFTAGTDFSVAVSYVAQKCGFVAHPLKAAQNASDKIAMRTCFKKAGVPSPAFTQIARNQLAAFIASGKLDAMQFPKVVKPVDNMGARGCRMIRSKAEFLAAVEEAIHASRTGRAILEDYMAGAEYSIDALVHDGTLTITGFADRHIFYEPYFIEMGHTMPSDADDKTKRELFQCFARAVQALGLTEGAAKADIKYTASGAMIGEVAARLSGGYMSGWTYPYASSLFLTREAMLIALGKEPAELLSRRKPLGIDCGGLALYEVPCEQCSAERAWLSIPGKVRAVSGIEEAAGIPFVRNVFVRSHAGDAVQFPRNNVEKCGNAISLALTRGLAVQASERCAARVFLRLEPSNAATDRYLAGKAKKAEEGFPPAVFALGAEQAAALAEQIAHAPKIARDAPVQPLVPPVLADCADTLTDCNHRTLRDTVRLFDALYPKHPPLDSRAFWNAVVRGGIQGAAYVTDCALKGSVKEKGGRGRRV